MMIRPAGILTNTATGRFHPIVFRMAPLPGDSDIPRYKSMGHHTDGFDSLEDAEKHIALQSEWTDTGRRWEWSGEDVPAMVEYFA